MTVSMFRTWASKLLLSAALGLGALAPAQATLVVGEWDPAFDPVKFPDLGWRGLIELDVPPACLAQAGPALYATGIGLCTGTTIVSAVVELYQVSQPGQPTLETLDFFGANALLSVDLVSIGLQGPGNVIGVDTFPSQPLASTIPLAVYLGNQASFEVDFDVTLLGPSVKMKWTAGAFSGFNVVEPTVKYRVPEPSTLLLGGAALLMLARRRRSPR
ncbi:MAG: hypothetical protein RJA10_657 [Pseudomonadota bacterium]|jgi:hypothetical protein